jgi:hypothetical protein
LANSILSPDLESWLQQLAQIGIAASKSLESLQILFSSGSARLAMAQFGREICPTNSSAHHARR